MGEQHSFTLPEERTSFHLSSEGRVLGWKEEGGGKNAGCERRGTSGKKDEWGGGRRDGA